MIPGLIIAGVLIVAMIVVIAQSTAENKRLVTTEYRLTSDKIPATMDGCRFAVLADLHNASVWDENEKLLMAVRSAEPDFVILAGDMVVAKDAKSESAVKLIRALAEEFPVFYTNGNHELGMRDRSKDKNKFPAYVEALGDKVIWLNDRTQWITMVTDVDGINHLIHRDITDIRMESVRENFVSGVNNTVSSMLSQGIYLHGLDLETRFYKRLGLPKMTSEDIEAKIGKGESEGYHMLVAHHPDYFAAYRAWGADVTFAGHIHGGMIRLPLLGGVVSPRIRFFPKYDRGRYTEEGKEMLVSGGLGNHSLKIRMNNLPELEVVTLHSLQNL